jgi:O-antigen/teichoic acid export membrane protein
MLLKALDPRLLLRTVRGLSATPMGRFAAASATVQGLPLISAPILARLYSPEAFGVYGVFYALAAIISAVALLSLNNAILNEQDDATAFCTLASLISPCAVFCGIIVLFFLGLPAEFFLWAFGDIDRSLFAFLPVTVFLASINTAGYSWILRMGRYDFLARYKLALGAGTLTLQIGIGVFRLEAIGLIIANLLGYLMAGGLVVWHIARDDRAYFRSWPKLGFLEVCQRNRGLVSHTTPASLVNMLANYLPELLVNRFFGAAVLGQYNLGMRVIGMPVAFISSTVQDVFRREATREFASTGGCVRTFSRVFQLMTGIAVFGLLPVVLLLPAVFPLIFGVAWTDAGELVQAVAVLILVRFVASPLSYVWIVTGRTGLDLMWQFGLVILTLGSFFGVRWLEPAVSPLNLLQTYGLVAGAWYLFCLTLSYRWSRIS